MPQTDGFIPLSPHFDGFIAYPPALKQGEKAPAIVVIQEIFGVNEGLRDKCRWLALHGFIALAPDLFYPFGKNIELSDQNPDELQRAFDLFPRYNVSQGIKDIQTSIDFARSLPPCTGKVGAVGYCLGGKLSYLNACHNNANANVSYYGVGIEQLLAQSNNITEPLLMHIAELDKFVPSQAQRAILSHFSNNSLVTIHSYPQVDHAFTRIGGDNYNAKAAEIADKRTIDFFKTTLADE